MKHFNVSALLICLLVSSCATRQQNNNTVELPEVWKFRIGDNPEYSTTAFNDQSWETIKVDNYWETQGYPLYDGIAWYRTSIDVPSSLKKNGDLLKAVRISPGRIDDADEIWFNGKKIGETTGSDIDRSYLIPFDLIRWNKENVIAVRVHDTGGNGGMYGSVHTLGNVRLPDILVLEVTNKPAAFSQQNSKFSETLIFHFRTDIKNLHGDLKIKVYDLKSKEVVFQKHESLIIGVGKNSSRTSEISLNRPGTYKIEYVFNAKSLSDTLKYSTLLSYKPGSHMDEKFEYPVVKNTIPDKASPFGLENITFGGYLNDRLNANLTQRLLNIDETGILECYYNRPGKQTWVGEYTGKYLHAASRVWRSTKNAAVKNADGQDCGYSNFMSE